jgi:hypothetical protein
LEPLPSFLLELARLSSNDVSGWAVSHVGIALTFGLVVLAMIYTVGDTTIRIIPFSCAIVPL